MEPRKRVKVDSVDCWRCGLHATELELRNHDVKCLLEYSEKNPTDHRYEEQAPSILLKRVNAFATNNSLSLLAINELYGILHDFQLGNVLLSPVYSFF